MDKKPTSWNKYKVVCEVCSAQVVRNNPSKTCGMKCRDILRNTRNIEAAPTACCPGCGEVKKLPRTSKGLKVCSQRCVGIVFARVRAPRDWDKWNSEKNARPVLGGIRNCAHCNAEFVVKRYDAKFCNIKCADNWNHAHGAKGENLRIKNAKKASEKYASIGSCNLCKTTFRDLVSGAELGLIRKNAKALFHLDHIIPTAKGGPNTIENTRYLCWFCNLSRMDMDSKHDAAIAAAGRAFWQTINKET